MTPKRKLEFQKATIGLLAIHTHVPPGAQSDPRHVAIARTKRFLALANHPYANEHEAQTALRMAQAVMRPHKIDQTQLIEDETKDQRAIRRLEYR